MRVLIAGGGTGGHLFPGIALAEEFKRRNPESICVFVGVKGGIESKVIPREGFGLRSIDIKGLKGKSFKEKVYNLFLIPQIICQSMALIKEYNPELVIGMGGYASAPVVFAALLMGIKRVICEQNTIPGITNRILARFANSIFISFSETRYLSSMKKTQFTGNPIRKKLIDGSLKGREHKGSFTLLILGGSQGAHSLNKKVLDALDYLVPVRESLNIIHQTGETDHQWVCQVYREKGFSSEVVGFIDDMATVYRNADLVICRAGATTISELTLYGKASVLVPYPFAANNHQEINARVLLDKGAAKMVLNGDLTGENLAEMVVDLTADPIAISRMRQESLKLGRPGAAKDIVDSCYELLGS
jgi:UDP-N-acetylglucosamine--N-acetylmuramyl-(pentapeptide) pyrophosphoryl-undecaprenol N-acetylglucosamine transferase